MALKSTLVTAPSMATVNKYKVSIPSTVNTDTLAVDDKAYTYYDNIIKGYKKAENAFSDLAAEYRKCASNSVTKGESLKAALKKLATACENQGSYCKNRKIQLQNAFELASLQHQVNELTAIVNSLK